MQNAISLLSCDMDNDKRVTLDEAQQSTFCGSWKQGNIDLLDKSGDGAVTAAEFLTILDIRLGCSQSNGCDLQPRKKRYIPL